MSRKDYVLISTVIRDIATDLAAGYAEPTGENVLADVIAGLAVALAKDNDRFDGNRFLQACTPEASK